MPQSFLLELVPVPVVGRGAAVDRGFAVAVGLAALAALASLAALALDEDAGLAVAEAVAEAEEDGEALGVAAGAGGGEGASGAGVGAVVVGAVEIVAEIPACVSSCAPLRLTSTRPRPPMTPTTMPAPRIQSPTGRRGRDRRSSPPVMLGETVSVPPEGASVFDSPPCQRGCSRRTVSLRSIPGSDTAAGLIGPGVYWCA
jgi:hypothetical protein